MEAKEQNATSATSAGSDTASNTVSGSTTAAASTAAGAPAAAQPAVKSAVAAGLLGIFLGTFGAHNWYLGQKKQGIIHLCIFGGAIVMLILSGILGVFTFLALSPILGVFATIFRIIAGAAMGGNAIWGLLEGIMILTKGDAGLAAQGYVVAAPVQPAAANTPLAAQPMPQPAAQTTAQPAIQTEAGTASANTPAETQANEQKAPSLSDTTEGKNPAA